MSRTGNTKTSDTEETEENADMDDLILQVNHLSKSFGTHEVLKDIDFTVKKGDVTSIIGASGSGKSTLLRCINLLETPSSGEILYHGKNVVGRGVNQPEYRSHVGMVFQSFNLFNNMTVLENCIVGQVQVLKRGRAEAKDHAMHYLEKVGMTPFINDGTPVASLWDVLRCLAYGSASLVPYWYIPFIMTVFSVGPLIFHMPTGLLQKILLPASVLPLMVPRLLVSPLRNLCFFVPIFLMGVYCARNRDACMAFIRRHLSAIRVTAVLTSLLIVADHYFGSFMPNIEGAYYVQKLCIGSWVLELLEGMDREVLALDFLARYSFPLFFLHAIFQGIFQAPLFQVLGAALPGQVFTIANLTVTVEIALCILCILKIMGKRSRYLIGG